VRGNMRCRRERRDRKRCTAPSACGRALCSRFGVVADSRRLAVPCDHALPQWLRPTPVSRACCSSAAFCFSDEHATAPMSMVELVALHARASESAGQKKRLRQDPSALHEECYRTCALHAWGGGGVLAA
jgi:hypothetical protein